MIWGWVQFIQQTIASEEMVFIMFSPPNVVFIQGRYLIE